jgi:hypothetical protein
LAKRIDDLEEWGEDVKARIRTLPQPLQAAARESTRMLLAMGLRHAPRHTGALRRSLRVWARATPGGGVQLALYSDDPAAGIQETGGVLRASGGRLMTVPIGEEREHWDRTGTRREAKTIAGLFWIRAKTGQEYLVTRRGRGLVLRFALRSAVKMPAQRWASKAVAAAVPHMAARVEARMTSHLLAGAQR